MLKIKFRFTSDHKDGFKPIGTLTNLYLDVTNRCNFNCRYCFNFDNIKESKIDLPISIIKKILSDDEVPKISNWILSGGEPLLYPDLDEALDLFKQMNIGPKIATNGTLLTPYVADKLVSLGVASVQFSLNTLDKNKFVELSNGTPDYLNKIITNLSYVVKLPLRKVVASVLTKINLPDIYELMLFLYNIGVDSYTVYLFTPGADLISMRDYMVDFDDIPNIIDKLIDHYYQICNTGIIDTNIFHILKTPIYEKWDSKLDLRMHGCSAGNMTLSVKTNGKVSPCLCQSSDEFICGDITDSNLSSIWNSQKLDNYRKSYNRIPECTVCEHLSSCRGGCRSNAYVFGNNGLNSFDPLCKSFHIYNSASVAANYER
jgi:radical SAM protein with 4Fe4S-binding SPASM domain